jgi:hypothetical protein
VSQQIIRIFDSARSPQWTTIQRRAFGSRPKRLALSRHLDGAFDEPSIHVRTDEKLPESHQSSFAERSLLGVETIQY